MSIPSLKSLCLEAITRSEGLLEQAHRALPCDNPIKGELVVHPWRYGLVPYDDKDDPCSFFIETLSTDSPKIDRFLPRRVAHFLKNRVIEVAYRGQHGISCFLAYPPRTENFRWHSVSLS